MRNFLMHICWSDQHQLTKCATSFSVFWWIMFLCFIYRCTLCIFIWTYWLVFFCNYPLWLIRHCTWHSPGLNDLLWRSPWLIWIFSAFSNLYHNQEESSIAGFHNTMQTVKKRQALNYDEVSHLFLCKRFNIMSKRCQHICVIIWFIPYAGTYASLVMYF